MNSYRIEIRYYSGAYAPCYIKAENQEAAWKIAHEFITPYDGVREIVVERIAAKKVKVWADVDALVRDAKSRWYCGQKAEQMQEALRKVMDICEITRPGKNGRLFYVRMTEDELEDFSDWDVKRFSLRSGDEYIFVAEDNGHILYALNVSGDSVMQSIAELTNLLAGKGW